MNRKTTYGGLDAFRIAAAVLVIAIHTSPLASFSANADFFFTRVLARVAVPFFLVVTGHFVLSDVLRRKPGASQRLKSCMKKLLLLYGGSIVLYIPLGIYAGHYSGVGLPALLRMLVFDGTFYHLWYFPACLLGLLLVALLSSKLKARTVAIIAVALYLLGLLGDSYYGLTQQLPILARVYEYGFQLWSYTRNGLFFVPVFLVMGAAIGGQKRPLKSSYAALGLLASFLLMTGEAFALRQAQWQRHDSMYVLLLPVTYFLDQLLLALPWSSRKSLRTAAAWIYILHPIVIVLVRGAAKVTRLPLLVSNSLLHYAAVTAVTLAAAFLLVWLLSCRKGQAFPRDRAWIEVELGALERNVAFLRSKLPPTCRLMPAVKADAYGHGAVLISKELQRLGVDAFCVACVQEGVQLRRARIKGEILVLGYTHPAQLDLLRRYRLTQAVVDEAYGEQLHAYGKRLHVHIAIDTGMHRLGMDSREMEEICRLFQMENLSVDGLFTHLAVSDGQDAAAQAFTRRQGRALEAVIAELKRRGIPCPKVHTQASYGVLNYPELAGDYARVGIALYGLLSTQEDTAKWRGALQPVLSLKARVASIRWIEAGESAGYGLDFAAPRPMKIAVLSIGYADGLPRALSYGVGAALIGGKRTPIVGRVCMDQTLVDVSEVPEVALGDIAVLIGSSGGQVITACDLAEQSGTITNEILSRMGARLERILV